MANGKPVRDNSSLEHLVSIGLCEECHTKCPKVGPQEKVEGVEGICAPACMLQVVHTTKQTIWGQFNSTVILEAIRVNF